MPFLLTVLLKNFGWTSLIKLVWNALDDELKKKVIQSENQIDDVAFDLVDAFIKEL